MRYSLVPAIIPQSFEHIVDALDQVLPEAREVQIDIVDGQFVPFTSWPYRGGSSVMRLHNIAAHTALEIDLMIQNPEEAVPVYVHAGATKIVVHLESVTQFEAIIAHRRLHTYALGISITNDTPLTKLIEHIPHADYVQLMGIRKIGSQGQPFDEEVILRIQTLRALYPDLLISVDGSVNRDTIPRLILAGANRLVCGSALYATPDPRSAFTALSEL